MDICCCLYVLNLSFTSIYNSYVTSPTFNGTHSPDFIKRCIFQYYPYSSHAPMCMFLMCIFSDDDYSTIISLLSNVGITLGILFNIFIYWKYSGPNLWGWGWWWWWEWGGELCNCQILPPNCFCYDLHFPFYNFIFSPIIIPPTFIVTYNCNYYVYVFNVSILATMGSYVTLSFYMLVSLILFVHPSYLLLRYTSPFY